MPPPLSRIAIAATLCLATSLAASTTRAQDSLDDDVEIEVAAPSEEADEERRSVEAPPSASEVLAPESEAAARVDADGSAADAEEDEQEREGDDPEEADPVRDFLDGFRFGSYGRIIAASDLQGMTGRSTRVVSHAPRVDEEDTYAELELRREDRMFGLRTRIVATVAYGGPLFHYDGEFSERIAIRNLFAEASDILTPGLTIWGGSRMARGDDVYLMDFWPLDALNLVGGGVGYAFEQLFELSLQAGMSQPSDPFQQQSVLVPARAGFLAEEVFILDRPRTVISGKFTLWPLGRLERDGVKGILYGEQHLLSAGERLADDGSRESLPEDSGYVLGAQLGGYLSDSRAFVNLFFRYARGLGVYDPLGVPFRTGTVVSTGRAEQIRVALSANWEWNESPDVGFGVQLGGYYELRRDADPAVWNRGAISEGALALRPHVFFGDVAGVALDLSYQAMATLALDERTGLPEGGSVTKLGIMPFVTPWGRGTYTRPHIRLLYVLSARDAGARALLNPADPRASRELEHFLGVSVEWWFSSTSYAP